MRGLAIGDDLMDVHSLVIPVATALVVVALVLTGSPGTAQQQGTPLSLEGEWEGLINYKRNPRNPPAEFYLWDLVQNGTRVTGKSRIIGARPPGPERHVEGTIDGNRLSLSVPSLLYAGYEIVIEGEMMMGTYRSSFGEVAELTGTRKRK